LCGTPGKARQDASLALDANGLFVAELERAHQRLADLHNAPLRLHDAASGMTRSLKKKVAEFMRDYTTEQAGKLSREVVALGTEQHLFVVDSDKNRNRRVAELGVLELVGARDQPEAGRLRCPATAAKFAGIGGGNRRAMNPINLRACCGENFVGFALGDGQRGRRDLSVVVQQNRDSHWGIVGSLRRGTKQGDREQGRRCDDAPFR
jgi:hypothetical protein